MLKEKINEIKLNEGDGNLNMEDMEGKIKDWQARYKEIRKSPELKEQVLDEIKTYLGLAGEDETLKNKLEAIRDYIEEKL